MIQVQNRFPMHTQLGQKPLNTIQSINSATKDMPHKKLLTIFEILIFQSREHTEEVK